jgi:predicted RNA-binding Zn-ribbon protein involved in translation (DUF1610 family)
LANWQCEECRIVLEAEDEGQNEPCPVCGEDMVEVFLNGET